MSGQPGQEPGTDRGIVLMLSSDLIFSSKVKAAAVRAGFDCRISQTLPTDEPIEAIRFVVVDLSNPRGTASQVVEHCGRHCPDAKLIAYGPHVQAGKLEAARQAGIETVMTNGQFSSRLTTLFATGNSDEPL